MIQILAQLLLDHLLEFKLRNWVSTAASSLAMNKYIQTIAIQCCLSHQAEETRMRAVLPTSLPQEGVMSRF
jgi:hypothetical protein